MGNETLNGFELAETPPVMVAQGMVGKGDLCRIIGLQNRNSLFHFLARLQQATAMQYRHIKVGKKTFYELRPILDAIASKTATAKPAKGKK